MRLADLTLLEKNARFMRGATFARLVANIKADGCLTSVPLVGHVDGKLLVASGNHRVPAAMKAGIEEADVMEILTPLTREQFVALQLAHNAVVGEDDPNILQSLYAELSFGWKEYSGLTDDAFKVEDLDTTVLRVGTPFYEELQIFFLPADAAIVFRADLERNPGNPRSLFGLAAALRKTGNADEAARVDASFVQAWRYAAAPLDINDL